MANCMKDAGFLGQYSLFENFFWNFFVRDGEGTADGGGMQDFVCVCLRPEAGVARIYRVTGRSKTTPNLATHGLHIQLSCNNCGH